MAGRVWSLSLCVLTILIHLNTADNVESPDRSPQVDLPLAAGNPRDYRMVVVKGGHMNRVRQDESTAVNAEEDQPAFEGLMEELASVLDEVNSEEELFEKTATGDMLPDPNSDANRRLIRLLSSTEDIAEERSEITDKLPKSIKKMMERMEKEKKEKMKEKKAPKNDRGKRSASQAAGINSASAGQGEELSRNKRLVTSVDSKKWTKGIVPFVIDPSMDVDEEAIRHAYRAMAVYEKYSCIRFVPWVNETTNQLLGLDHPGYLKFLIPQSGGNTTQSENNGLATPRCWATFGNTRKATGQGVACCKRDVCVHELGHALGFDHENQSPLYGNWIRINKASIDPVGLFNYNIKRADQTYTLGYDYTSIMHYGNRGWSIDGKDTISVFFPEMKTTNDIFYMFHELSDAYSCAVTNCADFTTTCANDGYVAFVNGQCVCRCPFLLDPATGCTTLIGEDEACIDNDPSCPAWASNGECTNNPGWMNVNCKLSCGQCGVPVCVDDNPSCPYWESIGECTSNPGYMHVSCKKSCGVCSLLAFPGGSYALPKTVDGCPSSGFTEGSLSHYGETTGGECTDSHPTCPTWASRGECTKNPGWMSANCQLSCDTCRACEDGSTKCPGWAANGECEKNPRYMLSTCRLSCRQCPPLANEVSASYHLDGTVSDHLEERKFCVTSGQAGDASMKWPSGSYCIYRRGGTCPEGFLVGFVQYNDQNQGDEITSSSGDVPDGVFTNNTQLVYCCRTDGFPWDPIHLPNTDPFALFKPEGDCQEVVGMHVQSEHMYFNNLDGPPASTIGLTPVSEIDSYSDHFKTEYCYYTPSNRNCGGAYTLSAANPSVTISSPAGSYYDCSWLFTAGENDRVVINFSEFHVTSSGDGCVDTLEIDSFRLGQSGLIYCGEDMQQSVSSQYNTLAMTYTTYDNSVSNFTATISIIDDATTCYNLVDGGRSYGGTINFTRSFVPCLSWSDPGVLECRHNTYDDLDRFDALAENYCRNPGNGVRPWCYTDATDCKRDYCDVCQDENRYDAEADCAAFKNAGSCTTDPQALAKCALTCQDELPAVETPADVSAVTCDPPTTPEHGVMVSPAKNSYSVGDVLTFKCDLSPATVDIVCLSTGAWSDAKTACVDCKDGWRYYNGSCYKYFYEFRFRDAAKSFCADQGAYLASSLDAAENAFLQSLKTRRLSVWLGLTDAVTEDTWLWDDGKAYEYSNWKSGEPNDYRNAEDCVVLSSDAAWNDMYCSSYAYSFICKHPQFERRSCQDQSLDCPYKATAGECESDPGYMLDSCPHSCDSCPTPAANETCEDLNATCPTWAESGFCESQYVEYMLVNCRCSCKLCSTDFYSHCADLVSANPDICTSQEHFMKRNCAATCDLSTC